MNIDRQDAITTLLSGVGLTVSIQDIQQIASIILAVVSIINILYVLISRLVHHIKNKEYDEISNDFNNAIDGLEKFTKKDKDGDD